MESPSSRRDPVTVYRRTNGLFWWDGSHLVFQSFGASCVHAVEARLMPVLAAASEWIDLGAIAAQAGLSRGEAESLVGALVQAGMLVASEAPGADDAMPSASRAVERGFPPFALAAHVDAYGSAGRASVSGRAWQPERTDLPSPLPVEARLGPCLRTRRSRRRFGAESVPLEKLATLFASAAGSLGAWTEEERRECQAPVREAGDPALPDELKLPYPTGGARNVLSLYLAASRVAGLSEGLYRFDPAGHALDRVASVPFEEVRLAVLDGVEFVAHAAFAVFVTARVGAPRAHYRNQYQLALIEVGHLAQNLLLVAEALGLAACELGAIDEDALFASMPSAEYEELAVVAIAGGPRR